MSQFYSDNMPETAFYQQNHSTIDGRNIWHYLIVTPIGHIHVVQYEERSLELKRFIIDESLSKAEKKYTQICVGIAKGKL